MQLELFNQKMDHLLTTEEMIDQFHIRVVHFFDKSNPKGGCTVAYAPEVYDDVGFPKGKFARVAVAWCNPKDMYSRKVGQEIAVSLLIQGNSILLPIYLSGHPVRVLKAIFTEVLDKDYLTW
jgi:hypothetical protein